MTTTAAAMPTWDRLVHAPVVSAELAEQSLLDMELARSRHMDAHRAPAERIIEVGAELGRSDLELRARLVLADIEARQGVPMEAEARMREVAAAAERAGAAYLLARAHFLLATVRQAVGDLPQARIHGIRSVELLPEDAPPGIRIDHLIMLAVAYGPGSDSEHCYSQALDLTAILGDPSKAVAIHNNVAFNALLRKDHATATSHVVRMLELARVRGFQLKASALDTVARVYIMNGQYADAIEVLRPVVEDAPGVLSPGSAGVLYTEPYAQPECLIALAEAHRLLGGYQTAQQVLDDARLLAVDRGLGATLTSIQAEQARLYADTGRFEDAYLEFVAFHEAAEALRSEEEEERARLVQASFDAGERRRDVERFRELALRDALTGLYNRRFIDDQLAGLTQRCAIEGTPLSAAIVDADFFKRVNDELSHEVGDVVLRQLADILASHVVAPETVGRLGGEEFVVLLPGAGAAEATARCEQIRRAVHEFDWAPITGQLRVTVSIGVSTAADGQTSPSALLSDADRNLYVAKRSGRNRVMSDPA